MEKYGLRFSDQYSPLQVEFDLIRGGGYMTIRGQRFGEGLLAHCLAARRMIWPERYEHRWTRLMYEEFIKNDVTVLMGSASSQKTSHAVEFSLLNYWARPHNTLVILSSTTLDKLDIGAYAELVMLWKSGRDRYPWLSGNILPHKRAITTDKLEDDGMRDFRKGAICRPCFVGGRWVGLGTLAGTKQDYIFYIADECQFMESTFSGSWPHLFSNGDVKIIAAGNPKHDPDDEL